MIRAQPTQGSWAMVVGIADVICVGRSVGTEPGIGHVLFNATPPANGIALQDECAYSACKLWR